jgi:hypothetical protein
MKDGAAVSTESTQDFQTPTVYQQGQGNNRRTAIDYSKFKTKMCRHFLMGMQCPFEDRCAFAHGNLEQFRTASPMKQQSSSSSSLAPPSYSTFIGSSMSDSPVDSRPDTPPAYPTRYRFEPYSSSGIVYEL